MMLGSKTTHDGRRLLGPSGGASCPSSLPFGDHTPACNDAHMKGHDCAWEPNESKCGDQFSGDMCGTDYYGDCNKAGGMFIKTRLPTMPWACFTCPTQSPCWIASEELEDGTQGVKMPISCGSAPAGPDEKMFVSIATDDGLCRLSMVHTSSTFGTDGAKKTVIFNLPGGGDVSPNKATNRMAQDHNAHIGQDPHLEVEDATQISITSVNGAFAWSEASKYYAGLPGDWKDANYPDNDADDVAYLNKAIPLLKTELQVQDSDRTIAFGHSSGGNMLYTWYLYSLVKKEQMPVDVLSMSGAGISKYSAFDQICDGNLCQGHKAVSKPGSEYTSLADMFEQSWGWDATATRANWADGITGDPNKGKSTSRMPETDVIDSHNIEIPNLAEIAGLTDDDRAKPGVSFCLVHGTEDSQVAFGGSNEMYDDQMITHTGGFYSQEHIFNFLSHNVGCTTPYVDSDKLMIKGLEDTGITGEVHKSDCGTAPNYLYHITLDGDDHGWSKSTSVVAPSALASCLTLEP